MNFGETRKVSKGVLLNVWTMAAESVSDIELIQKRMRASLDSDSIIRNRRMLLALTGNLSQALKASQEGKDVFESVKKTLIVIRDIMAMLGQLGEKSKDQHRIGVVNERLTTIRKKLEEAVGIVS